MDKLEIYVDKLGNVLENMLYYHNNIYRIKGYIVWEGEILKIGNNMYELMVDLDYCDSKYQYDNLIIDKLVYRLCKLPEDVVRDITKLIY